MRLTRRNRAALTLALEALRRRPHPSPLNSTAVRLLVEANAVLDHCDDASPIAGWLPEMRYRAGMARIIRARFALWIRAVLRADAGDFGHYFKTCTDDRCDCWGRKTWNSRRIRPLWERAPKTRAR